MELHVPDFAYQGVELGSSLTYIYALYILIYKAYILLYMLHLQEIASGRCRTQASKS